MKIRKKTKENIKKRVQLKKKAQHQVENKFLDEKETNLEK